MYDPNVVVCSRTNQEMEREERSEQQATWQGADACADASMAPCLFLAQP